ncbi:ATP-grasp ribosomal peptide maturase [Streptomyces sp. NPDC020412]|uniref:ATP-grasp ribosomal peptide maturase n=1 Tax=Streptomyces sp. NPDC020412 TaxID=3365073 RepID=UPI00379C4933
MTVLVLTRRHMDATADMVVAELSARGVPVVRLDPGDFPESSGLTARIDPGRTGWAGVWRGQHRDLPFEDVTSVYYRRPTGNRLRPGLSAEDARWAQGEARAGLGGVLTSLPCTWVNHPHRNAVADCVPVALAEAARSGLTVPPTLITNDPAEARDFVSALPRGRAAYKPLGNSAPGSHQGQQHVLWTTPVTADHITADVAVTAHLFQAWIDKAYEVRLTAVDDRLFAGEIHAGSEASRTDFRRDYDALTYAPCAHVPETVRRGVSTLMNTFGLRYAAMDFLVDHRGSWHAVDLNPNGQYGFIPHLREPISQAIADVLQGVTPSCPPPHRPTLRRPAGAWSTPSPPKAR